MLTKDVLKTVQQTAADQMMLIRRMSALVGTENTARILRDLANRLDGTVTKPFHR